MPFLLNALGRRTAKINFYKKEINRYIYDGNVLLHEFSYPLEERPKIIADDLGRLSFDKEEDTSNLTTWVFEEGSFVPQAKIVDGKTYSIISDYIGKPINAFDSNGNEVWSAEYDIYGNIKHCKGDKYFIPFRNQGQYEDEGLNGLMYNRHRYYDGDMGIYISKDPLELESGEFNFYTYVDDVNIWIDPFGLLRRPYIRKATRQAIENKAKVRNGRFYDSNIRSKPIEGGKMRNYSRAEGKYHLGHKSGHEHWREIQKAEAKGMTQKQFNDHMNNPDFYHIEDPHENMSHKHEKPKAKTKGKSKLKCK